MTLVIRHLEEEDLNAVLAIERAVFLAPWTRWMFRSEMTRKDSFFLAACLGELVVGYGGFYYVGEEGHITNMAVDPAYQGQGIGTRTMLRLVEIAQENGVKRLLLEVRVSNMAARKLYESFGFHKRGVRKKYYSEVGEDALILTVEDICSSEFETRIEKMAAKLGPE